MVDQHQLLSWADPVFYDTPALMRSDRTFTAFGPEELPQGWMSTQRDIWVVHQPGNCQLPVQGWKIHVSATSNNAARILRAVAEHCVRHGIPFKHLHHDRLLFAYNSKYVPRQSSGKFVTMYPLNDEQLSATVDELGAALDGEDSPNVLSDIRWGRGPLSLRFGGFLDRRRLTPDGDLVLALERPDGTLEPDVRRPVFRLPEWVEPPEAVRSCLAARSTAGAEQMTYDVLQALHFSNGGGVYVGRRRSDGVEVVLKEGRPHAGLDLAGRDAVARLHHEGDMLERLRGVPGVPRVLDRLRVWEHHFLAVERVVGDPLWAWVGREHPLLDPEHRPADLRLFTRRALRLAERLTQLVERAHERGVVIGDLHPGNVLVGPDREDPSLWLIDLEAAGELADGRYRPPFGAPGFLARGDRAGADIDAHALAALRLWLFLPYNPVWGMDPWSAVPRFAAEVARRFPVPAAYVRSIQAELTPRNGAVPPAASRGLPLEVSIDVPEPDWTAVRDSVVAGVLASATPERTDRLFPGDLLQFTYDGVCLAYGAAGVLWALNTAGIPVSPRHEEWFLAATERTLQPRPGFYSGLAGVAHVLEEFGHREAALRLLERSLQYLPDLTGVSLFSGLSGVGLNLLYFRRRTGDAGMKDVLADVTDRLVVALEDTRPRSPDGSTAAVGRHARIHAGLLRGWAGVALHFLHLYEDDGDPAWLELSRRALYRDLDTCIVTPNKSLQVHEPGVRTLAYVDGGSSGIAVVAARLLGHRPDDRLAEAMPALVRACSPELVIQSQLFMGRAGLLGALTCIGEQGGPTVRPAVERHMRRLAWHAVSYRGHLAFPGDQSYRLSMDLATGSAGVLTALEAAMSYLAGTTARVTPFLPFLEPGAAMDGESSSPSTEQRATAGRR